MCVLNNNLFSINFNLLSLCSCEGPTKEFCSVLVAIVIVVVIVVIVVGTVVVVVVVVVVLRCCLVFFSTEVFPVFPCTYDLHANRSYSVFRLAK